MSGASGGSSSVLASAEKPKQKKVKIADDAIEVSFSLTDFQKLTSYRSLLLFSHLIPCQSIASAPDSPADGLDRKAETKIVQSRPSILVERGIRCPSQQQSGGTRTGPKSEPFQDQICDFGRRKCGPQWLCAGLHEVEQLAF